MQGKITSEHSAAEPVYVGIDVCKERLEVSVHPTGRRWSLANSGDGLARLQRNLAALEVALVVMEATGKYHRLAQRRLTQAGLPVAVVNPLRARLFAEAIGAIAKTDRIDARMLALMGAALDPPARPPAPREIEALQELVRARSAAIADLTRLKNRYSDAQTSVLKAELRRQIANSDRSIARLSAEIERRIAADPTLERRRRILISIPGIGPTVAAVLLTDCAELGTLSPKATALLAGLAPIARDTGETSAQRHIKGGRKSLRNALYMAALAAARSNPTLKAFYQHLREQGKKPKVAITAVMRKLIILANTLIKDDRQWRPTPPRHSTQMLPLWENMQGWERREATGG